MALKDLVTKGSEFTEKQVEEIVSKYVRYDVDKKQIHSLYEFGPLKNRSKVLIYLVALHGWPFLTKESMPIEATPATIGKAINLAGGTLRPTLKELKDSHVISSTGKLYRVHTAAFGQIKEILAGSGKLETSTRPKNKAQAKKGGKAKGAKKKGLRDLKSMFDKFIADGFFDQSRVIGDVKNRFAEKGFTVPLSTLSGMLQKAAHEKLSREKKEVNKKRVWVYKRKK